MAELSQSELFAVQSIVAGVQGRDLKRRRRARSGWAFLVTAVVALPVIASALDDAISLTSALTRIGVALALSLFLASALGSLIDSFQTQAAITTVENAVLTARKAAEEDPTDDPSSTTSPERVSQEGP